jgi:hypothetical protein
MNFSQSFCNVLNASESRVLWRRSAPPAILPRSPHFVKMAVFQFYFQWGKHRKAPNACLIIVSVFVELFRDLYEIWWTLDVSLSEPSRNHIRPDTRLQIKGRINQHFNQMRVKFCTLTPNICQCYHLPLHLATIIVYTWQHQSRKLWMLSRI